jgi:hypothetical protein
MLKFILVLFVSVQLLVSGLSKAVEVTDLYQATITVDSQVPAQRQIATQKALQEVLLKVGGKQSVLSNSILRQAITSAELYQTQFHYQRKDNQLGLVVNFNSDKVNQLFKTAKLPLWGSLRPQVLVWLIDEIDSYKTLVSDDVSLLTNNIINRFSVVRGLPIIMPSSELVNQNTYQITDFWEYFPEKIQQASQRYSADTHVVVRISDSSLDSNQAPKRAKIYDCGILCVTPETLKTIDLDWRIYSQGTLYLRQYQGKDKEKLIQQGLSDITEFIYQSYALLTSTENDLVIEIHNINSLLTDTKVFNFISSLSAVNNIILLNAKGDVRRYKLDLVGSEESFFAALKLNKNLKEYVEDKRIINNQLQVRDSSNVEVINNKNSVSKISSDVQVSVIPQDNSQLYNQATISQNITEQTTLADNIALPISQLKLQMKVVILGEGNIPKVNLDDKIESTNTETLNQEAQKITNKPEIPMFYWEQQ